jgi:hypothetical protein
MEELSPIIDTNFASLGEDERSRWSVLLEGYRASHRALEVRGVTIAGVPIRIDKDPVLATPVATAGGAGNNSKGNKDEEHGIESQLDQSMEVDAPSSENPQPIATTNVEGAGAISDEEAGETTEILSSAEKKVFDSSVHVMRKEMVHLVILHLRFLNFLFRSAGVVPMPRSALITSTQRGRRSAFDVLLIVRSA